jgi:minor extracellular serine protease Vpr
LGDFSNFGVVTADFTVTDPANGCTTLTTDLTGKIGLINRGVCTFSTKIRNAQTAGASGALIVNSVAGDPIAMGQDGTPGQPTIPAAMLSKTDGNAIKPSGTVSIDGSSPSEFVTANADILAGFSSHGPTPFTYLIKPDVCAPGVNVYSSVFDDTFPDGFDNLRYDFALFQGTSMSTPHTAGSAALLLAAHPGWTPADVRSALVNAAARVVTDSSTGTVDPGVLARGGGRVDLVAATATPLTLDPATASFGFVGGNRMANATVAVSVHNISGSARSCTVSVTGPSIVSASPSTLTMNSGDTATLTVTLDAGKANLTTSGDYDGDVVVSTGATVLKVPWFVRIDRNNKP